MKQCERMSRPTLWRIYTAQEPEYWASRISEYRKASCVCDLYWIEKLIDRSQNLSKAASPHSHHMSKSHSAPASRRLGPRRAASRNSKPCQSRHAISHAHVSCIWLANMGVGYGRGLMPVLLYDAHKTSKLAFCDTSQVERTAKQQQNPAS